jgi:ElaA protein
VFVPSRGLQWGGHALKHGRMDALTFRLLDYAAFDVDLLYQVLSLRSRVFIVEQHCMYLDADGRDAIARHLLAYRGSALVGYLRMLPRGVVFAEQAIGRVLVVPEERGRGVGRALMQEALRILDTAPVSLSAQAHLVDWYATLGFRPTSDTYEEAGVPHVDMVRAPAGYRVG